MYTQSITRRHRTAFLLAIDGSGSMAEEIRFRGRTSTKAEAVAAIANELLFELIERARRSDGVRDYYDIALIGYSGDDEVYPLLPGGREMVSVTELAGIAPTLRRTAVECRLPDGEATDCDDEELRTVAGQIRDLGTADGRVLLINIHIAADAEGRSVFFPSEEERAYPNRYAALLCDCSSIMPEVFEAAIREAKGPGALPPFRGVSYNASADQLVAMLNIGSISVKTE